MNISEWFSNDILSETLGPQIVICTLYMFIVFLNIRRPKLCISKWYKTSTACILVISGLTFAYFFTKHSIDRYKECPIVDRYGISKGLRERPQIPTVRNLKPNEYKIWHTQMLQKGYLYVDDNTKTVDALYFNLAFIENFGKPLAKKLNFEQRKEYYWDKKIKPEYVVYISDLFNRFLAPYDTINHKPIFNPRKGLGVNWKKHINSSINEKRRLLDMFSSEKSTYEQLHAKEILISNLRQAICFSTLILTWGIWLLLNNKWKLSLTQYIIYILLTTISTIVLCVSSKPISNLVVSISILIELGILWIFIGLRFATQRRQ